MSARWAATHYSIGGLASIVAVVAVKLAYPQLHEFDAVLLLGVGAFLTAFGLSARFLLAGWPRAGMLFFGAVSALTVPTFALGAGQKLSTTVCQASVVLAAATPILFPRRQAMSILAVSLAGCSLVIADDQVRNVAIGRILVLIEQTGLYTALVTWFVWTLTRVAASEHEARARTESAKAELTEADRRRRRFLDRMSHQLRTPLNAVIGFSELLQMGHAGELNERQQEYVADVLSSGRHLLDLVDDVLDIGRIEQGIESLSLSRFPVDNVARESAAICREEAARRGVALSLAGVPALGEVTADERKVRQILLNLISNALKFTPPGGRVDVSISSDGAGFAIEVTDTGPGIAQGDRERIFHVYEQARPRDDTPQISGTGLGLPVARRLARLHGGDLTMTPSPSGGSVFTLSLPGSAHANRTELEPPSAEPSRWATSGDPGILDEGSALEALVGRDGIARYRARIAGVGFVAEAVGGIVLALLPHPSGFRLLAWPWAAIATCAVGLALFHPRAKLTARGLYLLVAGVVPVTGFYVWTVGSSLSPALATMLMVEAVAAFTAFRWRRALLIGVEVGLVYGVVLFRETYNYLTLPRWLITTGLVAGGAGIARWLLQFLPALVAAENVARRETETANLQLIAASRHKSEFLASMSHELRTPLNAIIGFADVLQQRYFGELNERQAGYVDDIETSGRKLLALINDILDLAKAEAGRLELNGAACRFGDVIDSVVARAVGAASGRGVKLTVDSAGAADVTVLADPHLLGRALECVIDNALVFTPPGGRVTVRASCTDEQRLSVAVSDSGPGIDPAYHELVFSAFEHADRHEQSGSGIGLALARRLTELHGGTLTLRSTPGEGSVFTFDVPLEAPVDGMRAATGGVSPFPAGQQERTTSMTIPARDRS